ncbi:MAG: RNA polymerase sigma factor [Planctomycetota bacterium]
MKKSGKSFEEIALVHLNSVYRAAVALCGKHNDAEDLVQVTFLKAMEKFSSFKSGTNCKAWLLTILRNSWIDELRHKKYNNHFVQLDEHMVEEQSQIEESTWTNAEDLLENFSDKQILNALGQLPDDQRLTLFLIDVEQYSQEDVAQITGVAIGTVKSRTSRARGVLKQQLEKYSKDMGYSRGEK